MSLIKATFRVKAEVSASPVIVDPKAEYRKKALENLGGSMVFVEREKLFWDGK